MGLLRLCLDLAVIYSFLVAFVFLYQRKLQYHPDNSRPGRPEDYGVPEMQTVYVTTADGLKLVGWFYPPKDRKNDRIVVMYHGNAGNITGRCVKAKYFIAHGYGVFLAEYRGFGGNPGSPTEQGLYSDARAALKWLEDAGYLPAQFVLYGESIGTGVAVQMAVEIQPKILILEAPFSSAVDVAKGVYWYLPVGRMMKDRFDSLAKIGQVRASLLIVHGDEDPTIPIALARKLFEAANHPKEFFTIERGGHNDLYDHHAGHIIADWLDVQTGHIREKSMTEAVKKKLKNALVYVVTVYIVVTVMLYFCQRQMMYPADRHTPGTPAEAGLPMMKTVDIKTADGLLLHAWFAPPSKPDGRVVAFFHGNAGNISYRAYKAPYFLKSHYGLLLCEYRGYGDNPGSPTEQGVYDDARGCLKFLKDRGYAHDQIIIYGESIGTGVAVQMALETQPEILVLEASFSRVLDILNAGVYRIFPADMLLKDRFDNVDKIGKIHTKLLVVHGTADGVIPLRVDRKLFDAANEPKTFYTLDGAGHNDLYNFGAGEKIIAWLDKQAGQGKAP